MNNIYSPDNQKIEELHRWIMELVIESRDLINFLIEDNQQEEIFYPNPSNYTFQEILKALVYLFHQGLILAYYPDSDIEKHNFIPSEGEIKRSLNNEVRIFYGLTSSGGDLIEVVSKVNWQKYFSYNFRNLDFDHIDFNHVELTSVNRELIESFLALPLHMDLTIVVNNSINWDVIENWQATYWKCLPQAYQVHYQCEEIDMLSVPYEYIRECFLVAKEWNKKWNRWYEPVHSD